jgi:hypothetical protein
METFNAKTYATDAVMTLALALNETLPNFNETVAENFQVNMTALKAAVQATMLTGATVSGGREEREGGREMGRGRGEEILPQLYVTALQNSTSLIYPGCSRLWPLLCT